MNAAMARYPGLPIPQELRPEAPRKDNLVNEALQAYRALLVEFPILEVRAGYAEWSEFSRIANQRLTTVLNPAELNIFIHQVCRPELNLKYRGPAITSLIHAAYASRKREFEIIIPPDLFVNHLGGKLQGSPHQPYVVRINGDGTYNAFFGAQYIDGIIRGDANGLPAHFLRKSRLEIIGNADFCAGNADDCTIRIHGNAAHLGNNAQRCSFEVYTKKAYENTRGNPLSRTNCKVKLLQNGTNKILEESKC